MAADDEAAELVLQAVLYNNADLLRELLSENPSALHHKDPIGRGALHYAAARGQVECARIIINAGVDVDTSAGLKDALKTPLQLASEMGHLRVVDMLVEAGADIFHTDANGYSALQLAQMNDQKKSAERLLAAIEGLRQEVAQLRSQLYTACIDGNEAAVHDVLARMPRSAYKQVINGEQMDEKSALYIASEHGRADIVRSLLTVSDHNIIYVTTGDNVLHAAVSSQNADTVSTILRKFHFLMDAANNEGSLPLHWACRCGDADVVRILMEFSYPEAEMKFIEDGRGRFCYKYVCDLNSADNDCRTPLYLAVANGHTAVVYYLANYKLHLLPTDTSSSGSDRAPSPDNNSGARYGCPFLLDVYSRNGRTPLMTACASGNEGIVRTLLDNNVDANLPIALTDAEISSLKPMEEVHCAGSGALVEAARTGNMRLVKLLLSHGALDYNNRALAMAVKSKNKELVAVLLCQLVSPDNENRVNKKRASELTFLHNAASGALLNVIPNMFPSNSTQLNWHNASLTELLEEWLIDSGMQLNQRIRQPRLALCAITRIDVSNNQLSTLPPLVFQLPSLRGLNLDHNCVASIELPTDATFQAASLQTLTFEGNYVDELPGKLFSGSHFPQLETVNAAGNRLRHLSTFVWTAPALKELNVSNNEISIVESTPRNETSSASDRHQRRYRRHFGGAGETPRLGRQSRADAHTSKSFDDDRNHRLKSPTDKKKPLTSAVQTAAVCDSEIHRVNLWQKKIYLSNIDDVEDDAPSTSALESTAPQTAGNFTNSLKTLNLSGNKLTKVPSCLACCCPRLTRLDLSMNEIASIGPVECLPGSLRHLNLAHNRLSKCFQRADARYLACEAPVQCGASTNTPTGADYVSRHGRSRSKSVVRNQRAMSAVRITEEQQGVELCVHKSHSRFEALKTLNLSHNNLSFVDLLVSLAASAQTELMESGQFDWKESLQQMKSYLICPVLTTLDLSNNSIRFLPPAVSLLSSLTVLILNGNKELESLPPELGLLDKLWNIGLKDCPLKEPLRGIVTADNYKTSDVIACLRNKLENSKSYSKLKLMFLGAPGVGKTQLLLQMRTEGQFSKKNIQSESWSRRLGHSPTRGTPMHSAQSGSDYPVDVSEWTYAPRKSSSKGESNGNGPVTFRMWDFNGLQKECHTITQYFLSRRAVYLVVWKVTDGEIAMNEIHEWLLTIQARAPNATVVIVGTHSECLRENAQRFTPEFIDDLERIIQYRFVNVSDADKKGLPRVAASVYVSSKTRDNVKSLCNLIYQISLELRSPGRRQRLLAEKVPAAFCALEKIVVNITDELRKKAEEAVLKTDRFWTLASSRMIEQYGKPFRDRLEFDQACAFLHENGVLIHFDDTSLREYYFIDPPWLCTVVQSTLACSDRRSSLGGGSMHEASFMPSSGLYSSLKSSIRRMQSTAQPGSSSERQKVMRACLLHLLSKFEVALPCLNRMVVLHSLLPDEYILRADYPGAKVKVRTKIDKWQIRRSLMSESMSPTHGNLSHRRLVRTLAYRTSVDEGSQSPRFTVPTTFSQSDSTPPKITVTFNETGTLRRLSLMQYIPPGFWPRLTTRLLDDDKLGTTMSRMFTLTPDRDNVTVAELQSLNAACNMAWDLTAEDAAGRAAGHLDGGFQWMIWQTGFEVLAFGSYAFSVKQFLPLANVRDVNYSMVESYRHSDDDVWRPASMDNAFLIEVLVPSLSVEVEHNGSTFKLIQDRRMATKFFALVSNILDDLLEDWFPALGTRYVHTSEGRLLVDRLVPCYDCATAWRKAEGARQALAFTDTGRINDDRERRTKANPIYLFSLDECILHARDKDTSNILNCPEHCRLSIDQMAPDVTFDDLNEDFVKPPENIRRGKLVGRGAFGFVFNGFMRQQNDRFVEVALKVLEPVDPGSGAKGSDLMAFEAFRLKWRNDILESSARAYHTVRQELNMVMELKHQHVTALLAFARRPLTLIVELAPHGALQDILTTYRRYDTRLPLNALGQTSVQVAKALEYLHANHIIYRDLKSENVLVWRFPPPHGGVADVQVKLGDYGISRYSYPSGVCMGYGGTEGFMAPEIMRYNGEQQYTEKVDCFSFGMFLYELISLKQPYDGQEQMKESILEGRRPYDLLMPSNVLDLMVVCWSEDADNRPSSSQLVCICSAPEYTHLLDVAVLPDTLTFNAATAVLPGSDEEADAAQLWMCAEDGSLVTMTCSTLGWVDKKVVLPMQKRKQHPRVTAMCPVEESVYVADQAGNIRIYSASAPNEFSLLHVSSLLQKSAATDPSVNHILFFAERRYVLFVQRTSISICAIDDGELPTLVNTIELAEDHWISSVAVIPSLGDWQIWTGHEHGKVILHHINGVKTRLVYAASVSHVPDADPVDLSAVRFIVASAAKPNIVFSALEQDGRLFQWKDGAVTKSLNVCKLLPVSESLSSMNIESARNNYVTSLIVHDVNDNENEQVVVGTSNGIIVIVQSGELTPLTSFRAYSSEVDRVISLSAHRLRLLGQRDISSASLSSLTQQLASTQISDSQRGSTELAPSEPLNMSDIYGAVSKVKDRVANILGNSKAAQNASSRSSGSHFITVGRGYRSLLSRFSSSAEVCAVLATSPDEQVAIVWRTDDWVLK